MYWITFKVLFTYSNVIINKDLQNIVHQTWLQNHISKGSKIIVSTFSLWKHGKTLKNWAKGTDFTLTFWKTINFKTIWVVPNFVYSSISLFCTNSLSMIDFARCMDFLEISRKVGKNIYSFACSRNFWQLCGWFPENPYNLRNCSGIESVQWFWLIYQVKGQL